MNFTHLHVHSHYSVLDGMSKVPDLIDKCLRTGMRAVALTDHGCMYGIKELLDYCKKANKKLKEKAYSPKWFIAASLTVMIATFRYLISLLLALPKSSRFSSSSKSFGSFSP